MIKVGFIGLGRIGTPIAANVCRAGYDLTVFDLREERVCEVGSPGGPGGAFRVPVPAATLAERALPRIMGIEKFART
jgi:3-hydroxyisobutyrate dehydrogenase-like beta-hydroxyacid dehydrogenase